MRLHPATPLSVAHRLHVLPYAGACGDATLNPCARATVRMNHSEETGMSSWKVIVVSAAIALISGCGYEPNGQKTAEGPAQSASHAMAESAPEVTSINAGKVGHSACHGPALRS